MWKLQLKANLACSLTDMRTLKSHHLDHLFFKINIFIEGYKQRAQCVVLTRYLDFSYIVKHAIRFDSGIIHIYVKTQCILYIFEC